MRMITIDSQAIRFHYKGGGTNVFWADLFGQRGARFYFRRLKHGFLCFVRNC